MSTRERVLVSPGEVHFTDGVWDKVTFASGYTLDLMPTSAFAGLFDTVAYWEGSGL